MTTNLNDKMSKWYDTTINKGTLAAMAADAVVINAAANPEAYEGKRYEPLAGDGIYSWCNVGGTWDYYLEPTTDGSGNIAVVINTPSTVTAVFAEVTADATPAGVSFGSLNAVFEASMVASDASGTTITLFGTNESGDITNGVLLGTFVLSTAGAGTDKDYGNVTVPYLQVYAVIASTSGTTPAINLNWAG